VSQRQLYLCFLQLSGDVPVSHFGGGTPTRMRAAESRTGGAAGFLPGRRSASASQLLPPLRGPPSIATNSQSPCQQRPLLPA
jgi:hypothetical protein